MSFEAIKLVKVVKFLTYFLPDKVWCMQVRTCTTETINYERTACFNFLNLLVKVLSLYPFEVNLGTIKLFVFSPS